MGLESLVESDDVLMDRKREVDCSFKQLNLETVLFEILFAEAFKSCCQFESTIKTYQTLSPFHQLP